MAEIFVSDPVWEDTPATLLARVCARRASGDESPFPFEGNLIQQADVAGIECIAFDSSGEEIATTTPSASDVIYDDLQTDGVFSRIVRGGNFAYELPATMFPTGSTKVRVEITLTLTGGEPVRLVSSFKVLNLIQS